MPNKKVRCFRVIVKVDEEKLRDTYNNASNTKDLVAVAFVDLEEDGIFLEEIIDFGLRDR
jgi:hypothetical protein